METTTTLTKEVKFDRETRDFAYYLNGELVGFAPTFDIATSRINALVFDLLAQAADATPEAPTAADLQAQMDAEIMAEFEAEEARAGVEETRRPVYPASVVTTVGGVDFELDSVAGTLTLNSLNGENAPLVIRERDIYALAAFFRQPIPDRVITDMEAARQDADYRAYKRAAAIEDAQHAARAATAARQVLRDAIARAKAAA